MRELLITPQFKKDFSKIPSAVRVQTDTIVAILQNNPLNETLNIKKLKGVKDKVWRTRINHYRLIYNFDKTSIILLRICHRKDIYKKL